MSIKCSCHLGCRPSAKHFPNCNSQQHCLDPSHCIDMFSLCTLHQHDEGCPKFHFLQCMSPTTPELLNSWISGLQSKANYWPLATTWENTEVKPWNSPDCRSHPSSSGKTTSCVGATCQGLTDWLVVAQLAMWASLQGQVQLQGIVHLGLTQANVCKQLPCHDVPCIIIGACWVAQGHSLA